MNKFSIVLEDMSWVLPKGTLVQPAELPASFSTIVDHDDEQTAIAIAVLQCEIQSGVEIHHRRYSASVCLIEDDMVN